MLEYVSSTAVRAREQLPIRLMPHNTSRIGIGREKHTEIQFVFEIKMFCYHDGDLGWNALHRDECSQRMLRIFGSYGYELFRYEISSAGRIKVVVVVLNFQKNRFGYTKGEYENVHAKFTTETE